MAEEKSTEPLDGAADGRRLRNAFLISLAFVAALWLVKGVELLAGVSLIRFGIYPGTVVGLRGVLLAPFIHGSLAHLFANTPPILVLGTALIYGYPKSARIVIPTLFVAVGVGVWLFARDSYHIGASGLSFGMMFFVFTIGVLRWDPRAIALALMVFFLYGGMIWGIFPGRPGISYESHLFGALTGIVLAFVLRNLDPPPPRKRYSWEEEDEQGSS